MTIGDNRDSAGSGRTRRITPVMPFGPTGALATADPDVPTQPVQGPDATVAGTPPMSAVAERLDLGDYTGALDLATAILDIDPDHREAAAARRECERRLEEIYLGRLGPTGRVPVVVITPEDVLWRNLDGRTAFLLSRIDGAATIDEVLDMSGLPLHAAGRMLCGLVEQRLVELRVPPRREKRSSGRIDTGKKEEGGR